MQPTLNVAEAELLFHFISRVAPTFVAVDEEESWRDPFVKFWKDNVPRLAFMHHFVLHLMYAIAAYHLAFTKDDRNERDHYITLAGDHLSRGVTEMTKTLSSINDDNCQALYIGAALVCYSTFAAGPTGPSDLLICDVDDEREHRCMPMIHGVRLIHTTVDSSILYSGLMAPLGPSDEVSNNTGPTFAREGFPRIAWEGALDKLHNFVSDDESSNRDIYIRALDGLIQTYNAIFGIGDGEYDGPPEYGFVFGWLYRLNNDYISCVRRREAPALLILAYYAVLFGTMKNAWFVQGWSGHLLSRITNFVGDEYYKWLEWPKCHILASHDETGASSV